MPRTSAAAAATAAAAAAAATTAAAAAAAAASRLSGGGTADQVDATSWKVQVNVQLPKSTRAMRVELTVHTLVQMTLEWPSFSGLQHGKANFAKLPNVDTLSIESSSRQTSKKKNQPSKTKARWSFARRQVDANLSDDEADTIREAAQARTHRDATVEDVHAMVMAIVDQELEDTGLGWPAGRDSLFTLRDSTGAMLVHNLLLAGAQGKDPRAHKLFLEIVHKVPRLLLDVHDGRLIFQGEGPLHVLAVNGRSMDEAEVVEKVLIDCVRTFRRDRTIRADELVSSRQWKEKTDHESSYMNGTELCVARPPYEAVRTKCFECCG